MTAAGGRAGATVAGAAGLIAVTTLVARVVGFGRWLVFSDTVGASCVGKVYSTANQLPNVLYEVAAGGALAAVVVPLVAGRLGRADRAGADRVASALLTWAVTVLVPLAVVLVLVARPVAQAMLRGEQCTGSTDLAVTMIRVFAVQVPLYGIGIVLSGLLHSHRRFLAAALAPLCSSAVVIASYLAFGALAAGRAGDLAHLPASAAYVLSVGTTLGVVALSLPLLVPVLRGGIRLRPTWRFPDGVLRRVTSLAGAGLLALVAQQACVLVTIVLANGPGGTGAINVYTYVQAVYLLPYAVLAVPVAMSAFPTLAAGADAATLSRAARLVVVAGALGAAVLVAVSGPVGGFFGAIDNARHSTAGAAALDAMPAALVAFAPGLLGFGLTALLTRSLYAHGRPRHAAAAMAAGWLVAAAVPLAVLRAGAGPQTTLATLGWCSSAGMTLAAVLQWRAVRSAWGPAAFRGVGRSLVVALAGGVLAAGAGLLLTHWWRPAGAGGSLGSGLVTGLLALAVFGAVARAGDPTTFSALSVRVRSRLSRGAGGQPARRSEHGRAR